MPSHFIDNTNINCFLEKKGKFLCVCDNIINYTTSHIVNSVLLSSKILKSAQYPNLYNIVGNSVTPNTNINISLLKEPLISLGLNVNDHICVYAFNNTFIEGCLFIWKYLVLSGFQNVYYFNYDWTKLDSKYFTQDYPKWNYIKCDYEHLSISISLEEVNLLNQNNQAKIIDVRPANQFNGLTNFFKFNGHIPNAVNSPFLNLFVKDGSGNVTPVYKSREEIQEIVDATGFTKNQNVIISCNTGSEIGVYIFALVNILDWSYENIRAYDGGWNLYQLAYQKDPLLYPIA